MPFTACSKKDPQSKKGTHSDLVGLDLTLRGGDVQCYDWMTLKVAIGGHEPRLMIANHASRSFEAQAGSENDGLKHGSQLLTMAIIPAEWHVDWAATSGWS
jgi:hypothetical protein